MESIGYVEVIGLSDAVMVSDHMLKAASVAIKNIENAHGGLITVSVTGDVAAVEAAVDAGTADQRIHVVSTTVLANPAEGIPELGKTDAFGPAPVKKTEPSSMTPGIRPKQVPAKQTKTAAPTPTKMTHTETATDEPADPKPAAPEAKTPKTTTKKTVTRRKATRSQTTKRRSSRQTPPKNDSGR